MEIKSVEFSKLQVSSLFQDYVNGQDPILAFYDTPPFDSSRIGQKIRSFHFQGNRKKSASLIKSYNSRFHPHPESLKNIERLSDPESLVVATGQQVTLYGGPLFTIYKTLSAIELARSLEEKYNRPVIPVFWLADEDHDSEEISEIGLLKGDERVECGADLSGYSCRSAEISLSGLIHDLRKCRDELLQETDFTGSLTSLLDRHYAEGKSAGEAFGGLLMELFGKHGLVLAGSNSSELKVELADVLKQSVTRCSEIFETLQDTTQQLEKQGYHGQVHIQESNLFYIDRQNRRVKLSRTGRLWSSGTREWSDREILDEIEKEPNRFSPNVFLRPILQDALLPVISYIAGPGETAYYAQMKQVYPLFNQTMPVITPRFSVTLIESSIGRILDKLPFSITEYGRRIEDLESQFIQQSDKPDVESIFRDWKKEVSRISGNFEASVAEIDPTLRKSAGKASATYYTELDKLKGKIYRSLKEQEKVQINRISKIKMNLYPGDALQERQIAFIYFMNKYGLGLWDELLERLRGETSQCHKIITL